jgi:hypothetical protein
MSRIVHGTLPWPEGPRVRVRAGLVAQGRSDEERFNAYDDETRYEQLERRPESIRSHRLRFPYLRDDGKFLPKAGLAEHTRVKDLVKTLNELAQPRSS